MKSIDFLIGVAFVWVISIFTYGIGSPPVKAQTPKVEVETTAYLHDSTSVWVANTNIAMQLIRFREGTVCVIAEPYNAHDMQMQCDFSNSSLVHNK